MALGHAHVQSFHAGLHIVLVRPYTRVFNRSF